MGSNFFGHYLAAPSPAHRLPVGVKYTLLFGVGVVPFLVGNPVVSVVRCRLARIVCARAVELPPNRSAVLPHDGRTLRVSRLAG